MDAMLLLLLLLSLSLMLLLPLDVVVVAFSISPAEFNASDWPAEIEAYVWQLAWQTKTNM